LLAAKVRKRVDKQLTFLIFFSGSGISCIKVEAADMITLMSTVRISVTQMQRAPWKTD
jgi:hypothetical protein